jgi:hypothetical protein
VEGEPMAGFWPSHEGRLPITMTSKQCSIYHEWLADMKIAK